jgi:hypothetical protein
MRYRVSEDARELPALEGAAGEPWRLAPNGIP